MDMMDFQPSPTGDAFFNSTAFIKAIMGPVGGGKSTIALMDLLRRATTQEPFNKVRRTKFILMRNTMQQLKATVKPLIDQWFVTLVDNKMGSWKLTEGIFEMRFKLSDDTVVHSDWCLMPADTPDDVRRLLSLEASAAWCEEAREIDSEVFSGLQGRVNRFPNRLSGGVTYPGVICSTNPPPVGGFWHTLLSAPDRHTEVFIQPPALLDDGSLNPDAENLANLAPEYYDNLVTGKTEEWIDVYLKNLYGAGNLGQPVFKGTFKKTFHIAKTNLVPILQSINPLIVGMDNGLQAAACIMQQDARGRVNVLGEVYVPEDATMGVETFLDRLLVPRLRNEYPGFKAENVVFVVDPACFQRSQVDEKTISEAVMRRGYRVVRANTNDPVKRIEAVEGLLTRQIDGAAGLLIDPRCTYLAAALEWGYRFRKSVSGAVMAVPEKNHYSHLADSLQYGCLHYNVQQQGSHYRYASAARKVIPHRYVYA